MRDQVEFAQQVAVVRGDDDDGVLVHPQPFDRLQQPSHQRVDLPELGVVHRRDCLALCLVFEAALGDALVDVLRPVEGQFRRTVRGHRQVVGELPSKFRRRIVGVVQAVVVRRQEGGFLAIRGGFEAVCDDLVEQEVGRVALLVEGETAGEPPDVPAEGGQTRGPSLAGEPRTADEVEAVEPPGGPGRLREVGVRGDADGPVAHLGEPLRHRRNRRGEDVVVATGTVRRGVGAGQHRGDRRLGPDGVREAGPGDPVGGYSRDTTPTPSARSPIADSVGVVSRL